MTMTTDEELWAIVRGESGSQASTEKIRTIAEELLRSRQLAAESYTRSPRVSILRQVRRVHAPVGVRCVLCKLYTSSRESPPSVVSFEVRYNGDDGMPQNPLCALTRRKYVCDDCIAALTKGEP